MTPLSRRPLSKPSLAEATAELVDATHALDTALAEWWRNTETDMAEVSTRWWIARKAFHEAILEPQESVAS